MARLAKLTRPSPAAAYPRERLFGLLKVRLDSAPVVWISGPPGSGKTTLVADYVARRQLECVWYQLDRGDDDIASFFHYLTESLLPWVGDAPLPQFQPEFLGDLEAFSRNYFREVFRRLDKPLLVLDNHHEVYTSAPLNGVLQQALGELPEDGALVVLSRNDPPAVFAGLRARGKLETLGWSDLRLTLEECAGVASVRGVALPEDSLHALYARTQGWAAGLVLMLQDWRRGEPPAERMGSTLPTVIFDYLAEEIFTKLADAEREALLKLAYLPQITASMARSLGVDEPARLALAELARSEFLATVMLVEPEPISQLHPLLRDFLLARAEQTGNESAILARKRRAAEVLSEYGHIEAAATLWIRLRDWPRLRQLVAGQASTLLRQGRHQLLEAWIRSLPEQDSADDPQLLYWLAACRYPYAPREARDLYARAFRAFETQPLIDGSLRLAALNGVLEAILHDSADDYAMLDPWIDKALGLTRDLSEWPTADLEGRLTCNLFMAAALRRPGHPQLHEWRARAQACCQAQPDPNVRITMESSLAVLASWNGQFAAAERTLQGLRQLLQRQDVTQVSATHIAQAEATHFMLCGDRARCLEAVKRGLEDAARSGIRLWNDTFLANALCGVLAEGDLEAAAAQLAAIDGKGTAGRRYDEFLRAYGSGWFASLRGDVFLAHQHAKTAVAMADAVGLPGFQILACLALAQVLMDGADQRGAERELGRVAQLATGLNNRMFEFMSSMCRARLAMLVGDAAALADSLRSGLAIARDRGLTYHMWWQPRVMAPLMQRALELGIEVEFVRRLVEQRDLCPEPPPYHLGSWPWRYRIRAFGAFQLETSTAADAASAKRSRRPMELLKALVAAGGEGVKLQSLADQLWPRVDSDYANQSLTTTLHRLRRLLGDERALLVQSGELTLNRRIVWCDTWAFESACSVAAVAANSARDAATLLASSQPLLALYRGPLLASEAEAPWAEAPRKFRRSQFVRVVSAIGQALERLPAPEQAIALYQQALELEPRAQSLLRLLVQALDREGRAAEAVELRATLLAPEH